MLDERQKSNLQKMVAISVVFVCVFILCPVIIYAVYSLTNEIQKYSITLADRSVSPSRSPSLLPPPSLSPSHLPHQIHFAQSV